MSKELIEQARDYTYQGDSWQLQQRLADLIEQQQKRIDEQALQVLSAQAQAQENYEQLAAAQAQIKVLRDALEAIQNRCGGEAQPNWDNSWETGNSRGWILDRTNIALVQPTDDSALREMLAAEREKCAKVCEEFLNGNWINTEANTAFLIGTTTCANKIRAMGSESPKLICPRCGVDRFKDKCPGPFHLCPIHGEAQ